MNISFLDAWYHFLMEKNKHLVTIDLPLIENPSRRLAVATILFGLVKAILLIPHLIILYFLSIVGMVFAIIAQFAVLFTGKYPAGMFRVVRGVILWHVRVSAYFLGLTDKYPPFSLD
jgi:hypothetical protein